MLHRLFWICAGFLLIAMPRLEAAEKSVAGVLFSVPEEWKQAEPSSPMRRFQFEIPGEKGSAELVVFHFGQGQGGDLKGNIDRWKSQFSNLTREESFAKTVHDIQVTEVVLEGSYQVAEGPMMAPQGDPKENYAMLGAIIGAPEGAVFLKMAGPKEVILNAKTGFDSLIDSLKIVNS